jgi:hypothetical protein
MLPDVEHSFAETCYACTECACCRLLLQCNKTQKNNEVRVCRVRDDDGKESVFETWFQSRQHGQLDIEILLYSKGTTLSFEGYACALERHDLKKCDSRRAMETLTIRLVPKDSEVALRTPAVMPTTICAIFLPRRRLKVRQDYLPGDPNQNDIFLCLNFNVSHGDVEEACLKIRNVLPNRTRWQLDEPEKQWLIMGGPAPGEYDATYSSPGSRKFLAYLLFVEASEIPDALDELQAFWREVYCEWQEEVDLELLFKTKCECFRVCLPVELPPRPERPLTLK